MPTRLPAVMNIYGNNWGIKGGSFLHRKTTHGEEEEGKKGEDKKKKRKKKK